MTWKEYDYYSIGHTRRIEHEWNLNRHLMSTMYNSTGMSKKQVKPTDIMQLPSIDKKKAKAFKKIDEAKIQELLKNFK
jgi:hypothetical protein